MTDNPLKLLMSEQDLHNLKKISIELNTHTNTVLKPLRDTFANEARRAINYNRKIDYAIKENERIVKLIQDLIGNRS